MFKIRKIVGSILVCILIFTFSLSINNIGVFAQTATRNFPFTEDTYAYHNPANLDTNYGSAATIDLRNGTESGTAYNRSGFVKVNFSSLNVTSISNAKLNFYVSGYSGYTGYIYAYQLNDDSWSQGTLTWNNKPTGGSYMANTAVNATGWYSIDVTSYIQGKMSNKLASFVLANASDVGVYQISSSEASSNQPYISMTYNATDAVMVADAKSNLHISYNGFDPSITLPTNDSNGATISWTSSDPNTINAATGAVTRHFGSDEQVTLTATIQYGSANDTAVFTVTVRKLASDADKVAADKDALQISYNGTDPNIMLPSIGTVYQSNITWSSNDPAINVTSKAVTRPVYEDGDKQVQLTATITNGTVSDTKTFIINITKLPGDADKVEADKSALNISYNGTDPNISLPSQGTIYGSAITWTCNDPNVINTATGAVTRPVGSDKTVQLIATIKSGNVQDTYTIPVLVKKQADILNFPVTEDAYTVSDANSINYGTSVELRCNNMSNSAHKEFSYIKVDFSGLDATKSDIVSAKLFIYVKSKVYANNGPVALFAVDPNAWNENTINDFNASGITGTNEIDTNVTYGLIPEWVPIDVTSIVQNQAGSKKVAFKLASKVDVGEYVFSSSEDQTHQPYLQIQAYTKSPAFTYYDSSNSPVSSLINAGSGSIQVDTTGTLSSTLMLVLYDQNGTMQDIAVDSKAITDGSQKSFSAKLTGLPADLTGYYVQAYLWNSFTGIKPFGDAILAGGTNIPAQSGTVNLTNLVSVDDNQIVTVTGQVTPFKYISNVTLEVLNPNQQISNIDFTNPQSVKQVINHIYQTKTDSKGNFVFRYKISKNSTSGVYKVFVGNQNTDTPSVSLSFKYTTPADKTVALGAVNAANDPNSMAAALQNDKFDIDFSLFNTLTNKNFVLDALINNHKNSNYVTFKSMLNVLNNSTVVEAINEANDSDRIKYLLDTYKSILTLDVDSRYNNILYGDTYCSLIQDNDKTSVYESIYKTDYNSVADVKSYFDEKVFVKAFNNLTSWGNVEKMLTDNNDILGIDFANYNQLSITGKANVDKDMVNKVILNSSPYTSLVDIKNNFYSFVTQEIQNANNSPVIGGGSQGNTTKITSSPSSAGSSSYVPIIPPTAAPVRTFNDLDRFDWARNSVNNLAAKGIVVGDNGYFYPEKNVTREQFIKMLMIGFNLVNDGEVCTFKDVDSNEWYYKYIASAEKCGIVRGMEDGTFGIGKEITRQEMCVMAYRVANYVKLQINPVKSSTKFDDDNQISQYAKDAISIMQQANIINGLDSNLFAPEKSSNRAEAACIIDRILKLKN